MTPLDVILAVVHDNLADVGLGDEVVHTDVGDLEAGFVLPVEFSTVLLP